MNGRYTYKGVAEKLHTSFDTVKAMETAGVLHDLREKKEGLKKHYAKFTAKEVNAIARVYRPRMGMEKLKAALANTPAPQTPKVPSEKLAAPPKNSHGVLSRLDHIEKLLTTLVEMWS